MSRVVERSSEAHRAGLSSDFARPSRPEQQFRPPQRRRASSSGHLQRPSEAERARAAPAGSSFLGFLEFSRVFSIFLNFLEFSRVFSSFLGFLEFSRFSRVFSAEFSRVFSSFLGFLEFSRFSRVFSAKWPRGPRASPAPPAPEATDANLKIDMSLNFWLAWNRKHCYLQHRSPWALEMSTRARLEPTTVFRFKYCKKPQRVIKEKTRNQ